jgi:PKD repeat protein
VQNPTVVYPTSGTYAVTLISGNGNGSDTLTQTALVNVLVGPTVSAGPDVALCLGAQTTLSSASASPNATLVWSPATGLSSTSIIHPVANPTATTVYTLAATLNGCTKTDTMQVTVNQTVAMAMGDTSICLGGSAMLHASGGTSYLWTPSTGLSNATIAHPVASPTSTTTYTVTVTANGCTSTAQVDVFVQVVNANAGADAAICLGNSTTLNATGGTLYNWSPAVGLSDASIANPIANPTATTTYTVTVTEGACSATDAVVVTVNNTVANAGSDATICLGASTQLSASGGTSYSWSPSTGLSNASISNPVASPAATTSYTVTVTANGCTATDVVEVIVNSVNANAGSDVAICSGASTQLSASGGTTYQWSPAAGLSSATIGNPVASPSVTTTYTVTAFANGCSATDDVVVTVNNTVANAGLDATICSGANTTLQASGGTTYSWSPSAGLSDASIANPVASPSATTTYTVTATANGCTSNDQVVVTVNSASVTAGADQTICVGGTTQLSATGNGTFSWSPATGLSNATAANPFASPAQTTTYTVTITENGCTATDDVVVNVNVVPANAGADVDVCLGSTAQLSASGGTDYSWSPSTGLSAANIANPTFTGSTTSTYTVTVTSNGCTGTDQVVVNVLGENASAGLDITVCPGNPATMQASGGTSYSWSPSTGLSATNIAAPTFNGTASQVYLVTIGNGSCSYVDTVSVSVGSVSANAGADQTICAGATAQLLASGGAVYSWSPSTGLSDATVANPVASPSATTTYVVTASSGTCVDTDTVTVVVLPAVIANAGADAAICLGGSTQLNASGGTTYAWSPTTGLSDANISNPVASPGVNTTYVVTVSNGQCSATDTLSVTIQTISLNVSGSGTICAGSSVQLSADAGITASYSWSPSAGLNSATIANPLASPAATTIYTVTAVNGACSATNTVQVSVTVLTFSAGPDVQVCAGGTVVLGSAASGNLNYSWSPTAGLNNANIAQPIASPSGSAAYYVTVTNNICTATDTVQVTVNPLPVPVITQSGNSLVANFPATSVQHWSMGGQILAGTASTNPYNPALDGSYTVTVVDNLGCIGESTPFSFLMTSIQAMDAQRLSVYPNPVEDNLRIEAEAGVEAELSISIVDLTGRTVVDVLQGQQVVKFGEWIPVRSLEPGIYLVRFSMKNQVVTCKFTKL